MMLSSQVSCRTARRTLSGVTIATVLLAAAILNAPGEDCPGR